MTLVVVLALAVACKSSAKPVPRLYTDDELAAMATGLDETLERNKTLRCPRPVLHGDPAPGPADEDLLALSEPTGELAACGKLMGDHAKLVSEHLKTPLGTAVPSELAGFAQVCGGVAAAFTRAAQHEDACSPYLIGRRAESHGFEIMGLAKAAAITARQLAGDGKGLEAVMLALDTFRAGQDFGRGGHVLFVMIGVATSGIAARSAAQVLTADIALTSSDLEAIDRALGLLIESEPHVRLMVTAEVDSARLQFALPALKPAGWAPHGGWPVERTQMSVEDMRPLTPRDTAGIMWETAGRWSAPLLAGCDETATLQTCAANAERSIEGQPAREAPLGPADLRRVIESANATGFVREQIVDTLALVARPTFAQMMRNYSRRTLQLAHLRVQVSVRARLLAGKGCPTLADAPFTETLAVPRLGDALELEETPHGLALKWPTWMGKPGPVEDRSLICPLRA